MKKLFHVPILLQLRLCLVRVKVFPENIPFSGNAIFRKENVFMCLAVTKFILRKINFGIWFIQTFLQKMHQIRQKKQNAAKENESNPAEEKMRSRGEGDS